MRIGLLATLRDEGPALPRFFAVLEALEADPRVDRLFCSFYENDSTDNTPQLLAAWLRDRPGVLQCEQLGLPRLRGRETSRTQRMAEARNRALQGFGREPLDWLVVIDADLHADVRHIWQLVEQLEHRPGVSMACASALQNVPDIFGRSAWSYYDSYALVDRCHWLGITGALVPLRNLEDRARWMAARPVAVCAAFGGIAVLRMHTVRRHQLHWDGSQGCEHWAFCAGVAAEGAVIACPQVTPLVLHPQPRAWDPAYPIRRRQELKQLWRAAMLKV